jgi:hypothetical protein
MENNQTETSAYPKEITMPEPTVRNPEGTINNSCGVDFVIDEVDKPTQIIMSSSSIEEEVKPTQIVMPE